MFRHVTASDSDPGNILVAAVLGQLAYPETVRASRGPNLLLLTYVLRAYTLLPCTTMVEFEVHM